MIKIKALIQNFITPYEREIKSEKIILAGDIVKEASLENFSNVKIINFFKNLCFAGNHDVNLN